MIGAFRNEGVVCIWIKKASDGNRWRSLCATDISVGDGFIVKKNKVSCPDCLRIAAQIAEDAEKLKGETG